MYTRLLLARALTRRLRNMPGAVIAMEPLRRWSVARPGTIVINDFDDDMKFELELSGHMGSQIFWYGTYSRHVLRVLDEILVRGMTVLDVGANAGEISLYCAKRVGPEGQVFAFEPLDLHFRRLRRNVELNDLVNVRALQLALGSESGTAPIYAEDSQFHDGSRHEGLATLYPDDTRDQLIQEVQVTTLDQLRAEGRLPTVDLLKIDVEGAELAVLQGAREVLASDRPWIVIEVQDGTSDAAGYDAQAILGLLSEHGYQFRRIDRSTPLKELTADELEGFQNVLAVPPGKETLTP